MSIHCDVILKWSATPDQLSALGRALWRWCGIVTSDKGIFQFLDNQGLADLVAGKLPPWSQDPWQAGRRGVHFRVRDQTSRTHQEAIECLRRELPPAGVVDVVIDGKSWALID